MHDSNLIEPSSYQVFGSRERLQGSKNAQCIDQLEQHLEQRDRETLLIYTLDVELGPR